MALSARYACLLLALALAASAAWAAADAPSPSPPCNNATHHDDALVVRARRATTMALRASCRRRRRHAAAAAYVPVRPPLRFAPLQTYFMTGKNLRVKDIREDKRGLTAVLETKLSETSSALPYIVRGSAQCLHDA